MKKNIIIIGGGIVGLSCAHYLQKEGHQVTVLDKSQMNGGASYVNAGYLTPSHIVPLAAPGMISKGLKYMFNSASPFYMKPRWDTDFVRWAWYFKKSSTHTKVARSIPLIRDINVLSRELYMDLRDSGELGTFHLERIGLLMLFQTQKSGDHEMKTAKKAEGLGLEVSYLDREGLQQLEPDVEIDSLGAIHYECDAHSTPPEVMARFKEYLPQRGVAIHSGEAVLDMTLENGRITKLITDKGAYQPDEVVLAAGSWTAQLSQKMGVSLPLQAGKGYRINVREKTGIRMPAILMEPKMAVTPMNGFTRFAGTMEFSGINDTIRQERVNAIARGAERFYKGLRIPQEAKAQAQCGLRPVSPDGLPYIGRSRKVGNLVFATGHAMMGYSLGPATGLLVSQLISGQPLAMDLSPFSPDRKF